MPRDNDAIWFDLNDAAHLRRFVWPCMARIRELGFGVMICAPTSPAVLQNHWLSILAGWCKTGVGRSAIHLVLGVPTSAAAVAAANWRYPDWSCPLRHAIYACDALRHRLDPLRSTALLRARSLYIPSEPLKWDADLYAGHVTRDYWLGASADGFRRFVADCAPAVTWLYHPAPEPAMLGGYVFESDNRRELVQAHLRAVAGMDHVRVISLGRYTPQHAAGWQVIDDETDLRQLESLGIRRDQIRRGRRIAPGLWPVEEVLHDGSDVPAACYAGSADKLPAALGVIT